jgi:hypothetical protein
MWAEKYEAAEKYLRSSMVKWTNQFGAHSPVALDSTAKLGTVLGKLRKYDEAVDVGITASRTVNPAQLGSVAITDNQSWVFSRHCTGGKVSLRMANKTYGRWQWKDR